MQNLDHFQTKATIKCHVKAMKMIIIAEEKWFILYVCHSRSKYS